MTAESAASEPAVRKNDVFFARATAKSVPPLNSAESAAFELARGQKPRFLPPADRTTYANSAESAARRLSAK
jgi:hypothetical protein